MSSDHFSVDGTLIDAWASMKSFQPRDGSGPPKGPGRNGDRDFHGQKRPNETHASTTDPDAWLYKKADGQLSRLCYMGHVLIENRNGIAVEATLTHASGTAEREATLVMLDRRKTKHRTTLGAEKAYDAADFVGDLRRRNITPHIAINGTVSKLGKVRKTAIDEATTRLCHQPTLPQAHRGNLRMDQGRSRLCIGQNSRQTKSGRLLLPRRRRLQPDPHPETACMTHNLSRPRKSCTARPNQPHPEPDTNRPNHPPKPKS